MRRHHVLLGACLGGLVTVTGCGSSSGGTSSQSDFCASARTVQAQFSAASAQLSGAFDSGASSSPDPQALDKVKQASAAADTAIATLAGNAPSEISADLAQLHTAFGKLNSAIQSAKSLSDLFNGSLASTVGSAGADVKNAGTRVDTYTKAHCGFVIDSSTSAAGTDQQPTTDATAATT